MAGSEHFRDGNTCYGTSSTPVIQQGFAEGILPHPLLDQTLDFSASVLNFCQLTLKAGMEGLGGLIG